MTATASRIPVAVPHKQSAPADRIQERSTAVQNVLAGVRVHRAVGSQMKATQHFTDAMNRSLDKDIRNEGVYVSDSVDLINLGWPLSAPQTPDTPASGFRDRPSRSPDANPPTSKPLEPPGPSRAELLLRSVFSPPAITLSSMYSAADLLLRLYLPPASLALAEISTQPDSSPTYTTLAHLGEFDVPGGGGRRTLEVLEGLQALAGSRRKAQSPNETDTRDRKTLHDIEQLRQQPSLLLSADAGAHVHHIPPKPPSDPGPPHESFASLAPTPTPPPIPSHPPKLYSFKSTPAQPLLVEPTQARERIPVLPPIRHVDPHPLPASAQSARLSEPHRDISRGLFDPGVGRLGPDFSNSGYLARMERLRRRQIYGDAAAKLVETGLEKGRRAPKHEREGTDMGSATDTAPVRGTSSGNTRARFAVGKPHRRQVKASKFLTNEAPQAMLHVHPGPLTPVPEVTEICEELPSPVPPLTAVAARSNPLTFFAKEATMDSSWTHFPEYNPTSSDIEIGRTHGKNEGSWAAELAALVYGAEADAGVQRHSEDNPITSVDLDTVTGEDEEPIIMVPPEPNSGPEHARTPMTVPAKSSVSRSTLPMGVVPHRVRVRPSDGVRVAKGTDWKVL
ncbi:hypothetical protein M427DRAFT_45174 [Gonapodya prolifera JEL478]|uniref:Uncharacterized protein n=1 Tax=Gonapodya prolifera (strain JEL478) TaxID=1344416 RepID=A0A139ABC6_GONPJ|nr:hypothetical protein M427DRAFT_45174 [Gonapodya prolifera JEL478]|eukprot:KXS14060.1 hypothetical protein M427DRAFT_45174 [Gonapodya prolifera JEL478]